MGQHFTDTMTVKVRVDEPSGVEQKRRAFATKLREVADMIEQDTAEVLPGNGATNNDAGFAAFDIQPTYVCPEHDRTVLEGACPDCVQEYPDEGEPIND